MPSPDQILTGLSTIANDWISLAIGWHVYYGLLGVMILARIYPSRRFGGILLALPIVSVAALAWLHANPFNGTLFALEALALISIALTFPRHRIGIAPRWMVIIGTFLLLFGWIYPHFLNVEYRWTYLYAAPIGLIPCPTLSASIGIALIWNGLGSRAWMLILSIFGLFYGFFGAFVLHVQMDLVLLFGAIIGVITVFTQQRKFDSMITREIRNFLPTQLKEKQIVSEEMISLFPPVVQKWIKRSNIIGKEIIQTVYLRQTGEMRTSRDGKWLRFEAEQFNTLDKPGFLWIARVRMAPMLHLAGRDKYENGKGHMLIKLLSLFPVVNARGPEIDQGCLVRYMAEIVWFPTAALSDYITWEELNSHTARATMTYGEVTASCLFEFTPDGDVRSLEAMRYYDRKKGATLEKWQIQADPAGFKEYEGIRIPAKSTVTWKLKEGDFTWLKLEIVELTYNNITEFSKPVFN